MTGLRTKLESLPFSRVAPDGTLDLWAVRASGSAKADRLRGRLYGALLLRTMCEADAPHVFHHVAVAARRVVGPACPVWEGVCEEFAASIQAAPATAISPWAWARLGAREPSLACLPFTARVDGRVVRVTPPAGDEGNAAGRLLGEVVCALVHRTGWIDPLLLDVAEPFPFADEGDPVRVGMNHMIAEIAMVARGGGSAFARAASEIAAAARADLTRPATRAPARAWA